MHMPMGIYPRAAVERAMKLQEVLLRATSGKIKWWQAAEMIGISGRLMRRWKKRYEASGFDGLLDLIVIMDDATSDIYYAQLALAGAS
jgi:hypothetical protein